MRGTSEVQGVSQVVCPVVVWEVVLVHSWCVWWGRVYVVVADVDSLLTYRGFLEVRVRVPAAEVVVLAEQ